MNRKRYKRFFFSYFVLTCYVRLCLPLLGLMEKVGPTFPAMKNAGLNL